MFEEGSLYICALTCENNTFTGWWLNGYWLNVCTSLLLLAPAQVFAPHPPLPHTHRVSFVLTGSSGKGGKKWEKDELVQSSPLLLHRALSDRKCSLDELIPNSATLDTNLVWSVTPWFFVQLYNQVFSYFCCFAIYVIRDTLKVI